MHVSAKVGVGSGSNGKSALVFIQSSQFSQSIHDKWPTALNKLETYNSKFKCLITIDQWRLETNERNSISYCRVSDFKVFTAKRHPRDVQCFLKAKLERSCICIMCPKLYPLVPLHDEEKALEFSSLNFTNCRSKGTLPICQVLKGNVYLDDIS